MSRVKAASVIAGVICLEIGFVMSILKYDDNIAIEKTYQQILTPSILGSVAFLVLWMWLNYSETEPHEVDASQRLTMASDQALLDDVSVRNLDTYHEIECFTLILHTLCYALFIAYGFEAYGEPCFDCDTPYNDIALAIMIIYGMRILSMGFYQIAENYRLKNLVREVDKYQVSSTHVNFFKVTLPKLKMSDFAVAMLYVCFLAILLSISCIVLASLWLGDGYCSVRCHKQFESTNAMITGMYAFELAFVIWVAFLLFFRRYLGVEGVSELARRHYSNARALQKKNRELEKQNNVV